MFATTINLSITTCGMCSIPFALPEHMMAKRKEDGREFFCPNGHKIAFEESELQKERKRAGTLAAKLDQTEASLHYERRRGMRLERKVSRLTKTVQV